MLHGDSVVNQHRMVVCRVKLVTRVKREYNVGPNLQWWKLEGEDHRLKFQQKVKEELGEVFPGDWEKTAEVVRVVAKDVLRVSSGKKKVLKETWWWNKEVQECIQQKKQAKKRWDREGNEESNREYKKRCKQVKKVVALARAETYRGLYESLESKEGEKEVYRIAKQRDRASRDVQKIRIIKDTEGKPLTREGDILKRWQEYFEKLMNEENDHEKRTDLATGTMREAPRVNMEEVRNAIKR